MRWVAKKNHKEALGEVQHKPTIFDIKEEFYMLRKESKLPILSALMRQSSLPTLSQTD